MLTKFLTYYHTIKHLKPAQLYAQLSFRFRHPKVDLAPPPSLRKTVTSWTPSISKEFVRQKQHHIILLNQTINISLPTVWTDPNLDQLTLYHLHYLDLLKESNSDKDLKSFLYRWISENPPAQGPGWEPYPLSLRIVNIIKWFLNSNAEREQEILHSLAIQVRYLSKKIEKHLLGNHLLANAKALIFAGLFFADQEAENWLAQGMQLFDREITEQILADGGHIERSPMYHAIILEDILDLLNLCQTFVPRKQLLDVHQMSWDLAMPTFAPLPKRQEIADLFQKLANFSFRMMRWLEKMTYANGKIAFFNDSTGGIASTFNELKNYQKNLALPSFEINENVRQTDYPQFTYLRESGYCCVRDENFHLLMDVGDIGPSYQPGHGHADTLSFELSIGEQQLLINSGISTYQESPERLRQRGTKAHNTLTINDQNSSEVWKSFRVGRRAKIRNLQIHPQAQELVVQATHDGYLSRYQLFHRRTWTISKNKMKICDEVVTKKLKRHNEKERYLFELNFHLHPDILVKQLDQHLIHFFDVNEQLLAIFSTDYPLTLKTCTYHPEFNLTLSNKKFSYHVEQQVPFTANASIEWNI